MRSFLTVIASAVVLAGCAGQTTKGYVRTDGGSVDLAQEQATLAQWLGIVGLGAEIQALPYLWRTSASEIK